MFEKDCFAEKDVMIVEEIDFLEWNFLLKVIISCHE